jgi:hypothetical protein
MRPNVAPKFPVDFSARFKIIGAMKRDLGTDLERIKPLAFPRGPSAAGRYSQSFHHVTIPRLMLTRMQSGLLWQVYDWLCVPLSLWPIDFEGSAKYL